MVDCDDIENSDWLLYDVNSLSYSPPEDLIVMFSILLIVFVATVIKLKFNFKRKPPAIINVLLAVILFNFLFLYLDFRTFNHTRKLAESGSAEVVQGIVESIDSWSGRPHQTVKVSGVLLSSKKGSSFTFPNDFKTAFKVGDCVLVHYIYSHSAMTKVFRKSN